MKKFLFIALGAVALLFGSCTKDNNEITDSLNPITGLEIPVSSAEKPVAAGEVVTINGKGFTASDEIWLSTATKASGEVKAEGFALTETGISFTAPAIDGEVSLMLKQNGKVHLLGKMFFAIKTQEPEPTNPITELKIPATSAEAPMIAGGTVAIKGKGFTASDEIWLSTATKASDEMKAEGFALTETGISFIAPAIDGEVSLTLKQNGKVYPLGMMFFSTPKELPEHVYAVKRTVDPSENEIYEVFEYDIATNALQPVFTHKGQAQMTVADNSNIYYRDNYDLMCYNVAEKKTTRMSNSFDNDNSSLGIIDSKLHAIRYDKTTGFSLASIAADGKQTFVKDFGPSPDQNYEFFSSSPFIYDATSQSVLLTGNIEQINGSGVGTALLSFSLETGTIVYKSKLGANLKNTAYALTKTKTEILLVTSIYDNSTEDDYVDVAITSINPRTLEKQVDVGTLTSEFRDPIYLANKHLLLGVRLSHFSPTTTWSYDLATKSHKKVEGLDDCCWLFTMHY